MELDKFTKTLAVMMGKCCPHVFPHPYAEANCIHCGINLGKNPFALFDIWSPIIDGELTPECRKWWAENLPEAWDSYLTYIHNTERQYRWCTGILNAQLDWRNLWKWMCENVDSWLCEDCPKCHGTEFSNVEHVGRFICDLCNGTGRVARWDVEKWLEGK